MRNIALVAAVIASAAVTACGGGGSSGSAPPGAPPVPPPLQGITIPQGLYVGTTSTGRTITGLVLDDGAYYVLYSAINTPSLIDGVVQGTGTSLNNNFSSSNGRDINLRGLGVSSPTVSANYVLSTSLNGSLTYQSASQTATFTSTYDKAYELIPSLATIAGTYSGDAGSPLGAERATTTISAAGAITGAGSSGCTFSGTVSPRSKGNAYNASITFGGSPCLLTNTTVTGGAYFDAGNRRIYAVGLTAARDTGFVFVGSKP